MSTSSTSTGILGSLIGSAVKNIAGQIGEVWGEHWKRDNLKQPRTDVIFWTGGHQFFESESPMSQAQSLDTMQGMNVYSLGGDKAQFELDGTREEGNFTGLDTKAINGIRYGDFATVFGDRALEGRWITVNRTEASEPTVSRFDEMKAAVAVGKGIRDVFAVADMLAKALKISRD